MESARGNLRPPLGPLFLSWAFWGMVTLAVGMPEGAHLGGGQCVLAAEGHSFEIADSDAIYFGEALHPKTPAVISADEVWLAIPEYKKVLDEDLSDDDPKYHLLMKKATERFQKALEKVAKREGYDVVGEVGAIEAVGDVKRDIPDATADMVDAVDRA